MELFLVAHGGRVADQIANTDEQSQHEPSPRTIAVMLDLILSSLMSPM